MPPLSVYITPSTVKNLRPPLSGPQTNLALQAALREANVWVLGKALQSFAQQGQTGEGGVRWPANYGDQPGGYAWFKKVVLGQSSPQVGVVNGKLRRSISADLNLPSLESRVGTPLLYGLDFHDGAPGHVFWMIGRRLTPQERGRRVRHGWMSQGGSQRDRPYRFPPFGQTPQATPARPFLPTETSVERILTGAVERNLLRSIDSRGGG